MCLHHATHAAHAMSKQQRSQEVYPKKQGFKTRNKWGPPAKKSQWKVRKKMIKIVKESV
jgi:hypothetical protein